jgi:hypothetical protein
VTSTTRRSGWLSGLVVGVAAGALSLVVPFVGWTISLAFLVGASVSRAALASVGGFLLGGGSSWIGLLAQADLRCRSFTGPGRECIAPDVSGFVVTAAVMLAAGSIATIAAARR